MLPSSFFLGAFKVFSIKLGTATFGGIPVVYRINGLKCAVMANLGGDSASAADDASLWLKVDPASL